MSQLPKIEGELRFGDQESWSDAKKAGEHNEVLFTEGEVSLTLATGEAYEGRMCFKKATRPSALTDPLRQVRLYSELNEGQFSALYQDGWVSNYVKGEQPTDREIADYALRLYRDHRRIVWDSHVEGNILSGPDGLVLVDVDYALRRGSVASDAVVFESPVNFEQHIDLAEQQLFRHLRRKEYREKIGSSYDDEKNYFYSLEMKLGLLYLEKNLESQLIKNEYIEKSIIRAMSIAASKKILVTVKTLEGLLLLEKIGRLKKMEESEVVRFLRQDEFQNSTSVLSRVGLLLSFACRQMVESLTLSRQHQKSDKLNEYIDNMAQGSQEPVIDSDLVKVLNVDRSETSRIARVIAMILTNASLMLLCLIGVGAAVFCWQQRRTGNSCWLFSEPKTLEKLRIARTTVSRDLARLKLM